MAKGEVRARMVTTAARLLAEKGPGGASFGDVLEASGAARGSTYHHFPRGKREMYDAALDLAASRAVTAIDAMRGEPAAAVVERFFAMWRTLLTHTELRVGCAVLAIAVAGEDTANVEHAGRIFADWAERLGSLLVDGGLAPEQARTVAALSIASAEGAVAVARVTGSLDDFDRIAARVTALAADGG